jgi:hypothetical protein
MSGVSCNSIDYDAFAVNATALNECLINANNGTTYLSGDGIQGCIQSTGASTDCVACWKNTFDEINACFENTCLIDKTTSIESELTQECIDCLTVLLNENMSGPYCDMPIPSPSEELDGIISSMMPWMYVPRGITCTPRDVLALNNEDDTISNCVSSVQGVSDWPTKNSIETCMASSGIQSNCFECWSNVFADYKSCFIDICYSGPTAIDSQPCVDCLELFSAHYYVNSTICRVPIQKLPTNLGETISTQVDKLLNDGQSKSAGVSFRSIVRTVFVLAAIAFMTI